MPEHSVYLEGCIGGGSVLANKPLGDREIACDLDPGLINLWKEIADPYSMIVPMIENTPYTEEVFLAAVDAYARGVWESNERWALDYMIKYRMSRDGLGNDFAWSDRTRGGQPGDANAWYTLPDVLDLVGERVADVEFVCGDMIKQIELLSSDDSVVFYLDPPYLKSTRTAKEAYGEYEVDLKYHIRLLGVLQEISGTFFLSGYRSPIYDQVAFACDWHKIEWDVANHSGQGETKQRRIEVVWSNRPFPGGELCRF